jgi:hypothetical protein
MAPSEMKGVNGHANGETSSRRLDLKVIRLNYGTSVDGVDRFMSIILRNIPMLLSKWNCSTTMKVDLFLMMVKGSFDAVEVEEARHEGNLR